MYLCFIDESGHVPSRKRSGYVRNFVIAGLIIPDAQWHGICREFEVAKRRFKVDGEIKWQFFGRDNEAKANCLLHLEFDRRCKLRDEVFKIVTTRRSVRIVATRTITKAAWELPYISNKTDMYHYTYKQTIERANYFLQDISKATGETQRGIVIADHRGPDDDRIMRQYHAAMTERDSAFTSTFKHFVERVMLTDSAHSVGIQLVDLCAGAIARAYNHPDDAFWLDRLRGNIRSHPKKGIDGYGIVHFPKGAAG